MLYRSWNYLNYKFAVPIPEDGNGLEAFADKDKVSNWAYVPLDTLAAIGVMKGTSSTVHSPQGTCTVEQAILLTYRVYTMIEAQK